MTNLDGADVGVLRDIFVLVEGILGQFSFLLLDGKLDEKEHNRFERGNWDIARALAGDVLMEQNQGRGGLVHADEFVGALQNIFRLLVWRRRLRKEQGQRDGLER